MGWKWGSSPKKGTAQPCQRGVNVDHKKSLGNCLYDGIYIMMAHNIKIYIYIFYVKYLMTKYWLVTSYEFVERIIYLKRCSHTPMLMNSTYWVISPPFISPYRYIRGNIEVGTHGRQ